MLELRRVPVPGWDAHGQAIFQVGIADDRRGSETGAEVGGEACAGSDRRRQRVNSALTNNRKSPSASDGTAATRTPAPGSTRPRDRSVEKIGRASCRERV